MIRVLLEPVYTSIMLLYFVFVMVIILSTHEAETR